MRESNWENWHHGLLQQQAIFINYVPKGSAEIESLHIMPRIMYQNF